MQSSSRNNMFGMVDWIAVTLYLILVIMGWLNIYAAVYDEAHASIFDISRRYGMQIIWIAISLSIGITILLIDDKYYHMFSYPMYWFTLMVLIAVAFFGKEVKGARSWIMLSETIAIQPAEFMKFATSLALARYMSNYSFSMANMRDLFRVVMLLGLPVMAIILQNDTGSAVIYGSFLFMLYREGFNGWVYVVLFMIITLFVFSFILTPFTLLLLLVLGCCLGVGLTYKNWRRVVVYLAGLSLGTLTVYSFCNIILKIEVDAYKSLLIGTLISVMPAIIYAYRRRMKVIYRYALLFCAAVLFTTTADYIFDNVMQVHQQKRVLDLLGVESDTKVWGYNVNQSKIAIGSGGFFGKGYLEGTQTKYNFVPEQSTDFIFCTVGEEWGFVGSVVVLALFCMLILRLMRMGERQHEAFGRVYCYCVASIFLFHVLINIGMTIGLMPVIGIPLPFFSYGGSSMIAFSLLFFVAVKLDSTKREVAVYTLN